MDVFVVAQPERQFVPCYEELRECCFDCRGEDFEQRRGICVCSGICAFFCLVGFNECHRRRSWRTARHSQLNDSAKISILFF